MVKSNTSVHNKFISTTTEDVPASPAEVQVLLIRLPADHMTPLQDILLDVYKCLGHMTFL